MRRTLIPLFLVALIFWLKGIIFLDPDFGWHLRMGQIILENGIPKTDPFSYTMPSYPFVDHEWLTNVLLTLSYPSLGTVGLSLIFSLLTVAALAISLPKLNSKWAIPAILLSSSILVIPFGIRPQVISWALLALVLKIIFNPKWNKWRYFLPIIFTFWVNLHGGFIAGIGVLGLILFLKSWQKKNFFVSDFLIFLLSVLATLINPYGLRIWWEVWMQISDNFLHRIVGEWTPTLLQPNLAYLIFLGISTALIWIFRKKLDQTKLYFYVFLTAFSLVATRNEALWAVAAVPIFINCLEIFFQQVGRNQSRKKRFGIVYNRFILFSLLIFLAQVSFALKDATSLSERNYYPKEAVEFLQAKIPSGEIFSSYNWGGYLIWKLPSKKVFIDGRMPSWRYQLSKTNESSQAIADYIQILHHPDNFEIFASKYNIETILWPISNAESWNIPGFYLNLFKKPTNLNLNSLFLDSLEKQGWKKIYQDNVAIILEHPKHSPI